MTNQDTELRENKENTELGVSPDVRDLKDDEIEIDLKELFYVVWDKIYLIICLACIAGLIAGIYTKYCIPKQYEATAKLFVVSKTSALTSLTDLQMGSTISKDYVELIKSRPVMESIISKESLEDTVDELREKITVANDSDSRVLSITIRYTDAALAARIANDLMYIAQKELSEVMSVNEPAIVEDAVVNPVAVSPSVLINTLTAMLLMVVLASGIFIVRFLMDDKIKNVEDVEKNLGLNVLSAIPTTE